jgi:ubiquinone/menaquinone biosynthesis C-methylase UbiE
MEDFVMNEQSFDQEKAEAFAGRMVDMLNQAALTLMTSVGHQVGLFDTLAGQPPATSQQIAAAARLNERYVREWLGAMTTGQIVACDPQDETYWLPAEHARWLTRSVGADNLAVQAPYIPMLAQVEEPIIECFRNGGGVPYSAYPRLQELMRAETGAVHDAVLVNDVLPLVPGLVDRLQAGIEVADVGCGSGHALNLMAQAFPQSHFVGYDLSETGITMGRREAQELGLNNVRFEQCNVSNLNAPNRFGLMTAFDAIHDQARPAQVLQNIHAALQPDGLFLMVDFGASSHIHENMDFPLGPFLYTISCMHCMTVSLAENGDGLGAMWGEQKARQMLAEAGFSDVEVKQVEGDILNNYYIAYK